MNAFVLCQQSSAFNNGFLLIIKWYDVCISDLNSSKARLYKNIKEKGHFMLDASVCIPIMTWFKMATALDCSKLEAFGVSGGILKTGVLLYLSLNSYNSTIS